MDTSSQGNAHPSKPTGFCCKPGGFRCGLIWGLLIMLTVVIVVPVIVAATGVINVSAQQSFGPIDAFLGYARNRPAGCDRLGGPLTVLAGVQL